MILLLLLQLLGAANSELCYAKFNYAANSTLGPQSYWKCSENGAVPQLSSCEDGTVYDRKSGLCVEGHTVRPNGRIVRRDAGVDGDMGEVIEREALGETLILGTLFDARTSLMANGLSFWTPATLENKGTLMDTVYSNVDVFMDNSIRERAFSLKLSAGIKLEFLGGLITVEGSAKYLRDEVSKSNIARVTMNYKATTKTRTIPVKVAKDHRELCQKISPEQGPTHVVTSITYGMRSFLVFEKRVEVTEYKEEVGGSLSIALNTVPSFNIGGSAAVDVNGEAAKNLEQTKIRFYGDAIIDKMPATYNQSIYVFDEVNRQAKESMTPIQYQLTPIGHFCDGIDSVLNDVSAALTEQATGVLTELQDLTRVVKTLLAKDPSIRFTSIRSQLVTFESELKAYTNKKTSEVANLLPALKAGDADEEELKHMISDYRTSHFQKDNAMIFLNNRAREIRTIELVTETAKGIREVELSDIGAATDNKCIFNQKYATVYQLYVLPAANVALNFIEGTMIDESSMWYNDLYRVGQVGAILNDFLGYAANSAGPDHCMLIRLDNITNNANPEKDVVIRLYENGEEREGDFIAPVAPPTPTCSRSLFDGVELAVEPSTEPSSVVTGINVNGFYMVEKKDVPENATEEEKYEKIFSSELNENKKTVRLSQLKPNTVYFLQVQYIVGGEVGASPWSKTVTCSTAATSSPVLPLVTGQTESSISVRWSPPQQSTVDNTIRYTVTATTAEGIDVRQLETGETQATLDSLEPGHYYNITIQSVFDNIRSDKARISSTTKPYPLEAPEPSAVDETKIVLNIHTDRLSLPAQVRMESLIVSYCKMDITGAEELYGTDRSVTREVNKDKTAPTRVTLENLDGGVKYGIRARLRLRIDSTGERIETESSEMMIVGTDLGEGDFTELAAEFAKYKDQVDSDLKGLETEVSKLDGKLSAKEAEVDAALGGLEDKIEKKSQDMAGTFLSYHEIVSGAVRESCIKRGVQYYTTNVKPTAVFDAKSEYYCLFKCRTSSVVFSIRSRKCSCIEARPWFSSVIVYQNQDYISANRHCWRLGMASTAKWEQCVHKNRKYTKQTAIVEIPASPSIRHCAFSCADRQGCIGISYKRQTGICTLLGSSSGETGATGTDILHLGCLVG